MKRSLLLFLLALGLLLPLLPSTSFAQTKLTVVAQEARAQEPELTKDMLSWLLEVRAAPLQPVRRFVPGVENEALDSDVLSL